MPSYFRGEVVVVLYPFTDGRVEMPRPALVVSSDQYNALTGDLVLAMITSRLRNPMVPGDFKLLDWAFTLLHRECKVRLGKLNTIASSEIRQSLGRLSDRDMAGVDIALREALSL